VVHVSTFVASESTSVCYPGATSIGVLSQA
jgi:hypothetical protein